MPSSTGDRSYGYEMPPTLVHSLVAGVTWALHCAACRREIAVDVIKLLEGVDDVLSFDSTATFARAKCRQCGGRMKVTGGFQVSMLKRGGHIPRLIVSDGSDWRKLSAQSSCGSVLLHEPL